MWPSTRICELFGIEHPIVQAPMAGSDTPELAAAVTNAGGLGSMGLTGHSPDDIRPPLPARQRTARSTTTSSSIAFRQRIRSDGRAPSRRSHRSIRTAGLCQRPTLRGNGWR